MWTWGRTSSPLIVTDTEDEGGTMWRAVCRSRGGGLRILGRDVGPTVVTCFGHQEREFERQVSRAGVRTLRRLLDVSDRELLRTIGERFATTHDLETFLAENGIPTEFWVRLGD